MTCRTRWVLVALALTAPCAISTAQAQKAAAQTSSPFKPIKAPTLDPDLYKAPPNAGADRPTLIKSGTEQRKPLPPNRIELGKYQLELNAGHAKDLYTGGGPISGQSADLSAPNPVQKKDSVLPDYLGLKLSRPIH